MHLHRITPRELKSVLLRGSPQSDFPAGQRRATSLTRLAPRRSRASEGPPGARPTPSSKRDVHYTLNTTDFDKQPVGLCLLHRIVASVYTTCAVLVIYLENSSCHFSTIKENQVGLAIVLKLF